MISLTFILAFAFLNKYLLHQHNPDNSTVVSNAIIEENRNLLVQKNYSAIIANLGDIQLQKDESSQQIHLLLAQSYFALKEFDSAIEHYLSAISLSQSASEKSTLYNNLANCYRDKGSTSEAISNYRLAAETFANPQAWINLAYLYKNTGDTNQAITVLQTAKSTFPKNADILELLAKFRG